MRVQCRLVIDMAANGRAEAHLEPSITVPRGTRPEPRPTWCRRTVKAADLAAAALGFDVVMSSDDPEAARRYATAASLDAWEPLKVGEQ